MRIAQALTIGLLVLAVAFGATLYTQRSEVIVLHRAGNPSKIYIAKFDALGSAATNKISCEEFKGFVEKLSPETGPVRCSPLD